MNLNLHSCLTVESLVLQYEAVFTSSKGLAHKGNFVELKSEVQYGVLLACCGAIDPTIDFCVIQELELQTNHNREPILTEYDCPLYLSSNIHIVSTKTILSKVSFVFCVR